MFSLIRRSLSAEKSAIFNKSKFSFFRAAVSTSEIMKSNGMEKFYGMQLKNQVQEKKKVFFSALVPRAFKIYLTSSQFYFNSKETFLCFI